jgi:Type IV secretion system pilin
VKEAFAMTREVLADVSSLSDVIANLINWIRMFLVALATLFLTIGGVLYLTAGGDPGAVEKAKNCLKSATVGYGLAILAPLLIAALQHIVGG